MAGFNEQNLSSPKSPQVTQGTILHVQYILEMTEGDCVVPVRQDVGKIAALPEVSCGVLFL